MEQMNPPESLSMEGKLAENWSEWLQCFQIFLEASNIEEYQKR